MGTFGFAWSSVTERSHEAGCRMLDRASSNIWEASQVHVLLVGRQSSSSRLASHLVIVAAPAGGPQLPTGSSIRCIGLR